ncbi:Protein of unknown function [Gryllus bimaculatus]|nr:Protein of unknown function [Gryllus bimaculatus]
MTLIEGFWVCSGRINVKASYIEAYWGRTLASVEEVPFAPKTFKTSLVVLAQKIFILAVLIDESRYFHLKATKFIMIFSP